MRALPSPLLVLPFATGTPLRHASLLCVVLCIDQWSRLARIRGTAHEELRTAEEGAGLPREARLIVVHQIHKSNTRGYTRGHGARVQHTAAGNAGSQAILGTLPY